MPKTKRYLTEDEKNQIWDKELLLDIGELFSNGSETWTVKHVDLAKLERNDLITI